MARTVDTEAHAVRREAFVDVAQRLMQAKGYEQMSIQDVLDEVGRVARRLLPLLRLQDGAARGGRHAHRRRGAGLGDPARRGPGARRPGQARGPLRRHRPVEDGAHRAHAGADARLALGREHPHARQDVAAPDAAARAAAGGDPAAGRRRRRLRRRLSRRHGARAGRAAARAQRPRGAHVRRRATGAASSLAAVEAMLAAYIEAMERILGVPAGTLTLVDEAVLREWYA